MPSDAPKRAHTGIHHDRPAKIAKPGKKQWRVPRTSNRNGSAPASGAGAHANAKSDPARFARLHTFQAGDAGIWATCNLGMEARCRAELEDLFLDYAEKLYGAESGAAPAAADAGGDIEGAIAAELAALQAPPTDASADPPVSYVATDSQCVLFFKTRAPIDPVRLVRAVCTDAAAPGRAQRTRYARRLVPSTLLAKATERGLESACAEVLPAAFTEPSKFAIRPNIRHNNQLARDDVIRQVAAAVGQGHSVDLTKYDKLILLEIHKSFLGISVVPGDYEKLKRYNLAEIYEMSESPAETAEREKWIEYRRQKKGRSKDDQVNAKPKTQTETQDENLKKDELAAEPAGKPKPDSQNQTETQQPEQPKAAPEEQKDENADPAASITTIPTDSTGP